VNISDFLDLPERFKGMEINMKKPTGIIPETFYPRSEIYVHLHAWKRIQRMVSI
jgi:hypothetical protein